MVCEFRDQTWLTPIFGRPILPTRSWPSRGDGLSRAGHQDGVSRCEGATPKLTLSSKIQEARSAHRPTAASFFPSARACPSSPPISPCGLTASPIHPCVPVPAPLRRVSDPRLRVPRGQRSVPSITRRDRPPCLSLYLRASTGASPLRSHVSVLDGCAAFSRLVSYLNWLSPCTPFVALN